MTRIGKRRQNAWIAAAATLAASATTAQSQTQFSTLTVLGDSFADNGNLAKLLVLSPPVPYPSNGVPFVLQPFITYPRPLQLLLGIPDDATTNFAVGGSTSGAAGLLPGTSFPFQVALASQSGKAFGPRDLITINIGGDDAGAASGGLTSAAQALTVATQAAANIQNGMLQLVAAGGRNFMLGTFSDLAETSSIANSNNPALIANSRLYAQTLLQQEQLRLAPLAQAGVRIFTFDFFQFAKEVEAHPAAYGFTATRAPCGGTPACATATSPGQFTNVSFDGLHLTTGAFQVVGEYMAKLLQTPQTYPAQADITQITATNFSDSFFGRLEAYRSANESTFAAPLPVKALRTGSTESPMTMFMEATGASGSRENAVDKLGFGYGLGGGQIGLDYRVNSNFRAGGMFNYSNVALHLNDGYGHIKDDAFQIGGYASLTYPNWFFDAVTTGGTQKLNIDRPGVISTINGRTDADTFTIGAQSAYLYDITGRLRAGPLLGLGYAHSRVDGYTETGDPLLTFTVDSQKLSSLVGGAGVQIRYSFAMFDRPISPFVNLTLEHDFIGGARTILATETQTPLLPIPTPVAGFNRTFGKLQSGVSALLTERLSLTYNIVSTFGHDHNDVGGNVGMNYRF